MSSTSNLNGEPGVFSERQWIILILIALCLASGVLAINRYFYHRPNVLLITIDTLRADSLGCYNPALNTSPNIDRIAEQGYLFERCYASSSWTMPSVMSIHTGKYPFRHGVEWVDKPLPTSIPTLAEKLREQGFMTGAVESSLFLQSQFGFGRGFDHYEEEPIHDHSAISSPSLTRRALAWLEDHLHRPFFFWIHYLDPHYDYLPHAEAAHFVTHIPEIAQGKEYPILELKNTPYSLTPEEYEYQRQLYHGEIFFTDLYIGQLMQFLKDAGVWDQTWVIITSDHGEMLGEHGALGHTESFYNEVLHVPLIIKPPRGLKKPRRINDRVSLVDIMPTLLRRMKITHDPRDFDGVDILNDAAMNREPWARTLTPEVDFVARMGNLKFVYEPQSDTRWVFDLLLPQREKENLYDHHQKAFEGFLQQVYTTVEKHDPEADLMEVPEELLDQIRKHGYLGRR